ncbi:CpXC domain-containing protein [Micromonospora sp. DT63]|uniref:CpXC domain-containing protein n=1 Tax=Micromonospora sp. DT63 TaxID=3393441 RepID=UPI003CF58109
MARNVSLPQYPPTRCVGCGAPYAPELHVVVDATERPDLVQRIKDDILHCAICPHCGVIMSFGMPLLVYRPGEPVPVLYSPVPIANPQQRDMHAEMLLAALSRQLGPDWDDRLANDVYVVERDRLPEVVDVNPDLLAGGRDPSLRHAMDLFLHCSSWEQARAAVEAHRDLLLSREAEIVLRRGIDRTHDNGLDDAVATLTDHLAVLRECRERGVAAAFAGRVDGSGCTPKAWRVG